MRIMQNIIFAGFTLFSWHELCAPLFQFVLGVVKYIFYWKIEFIHARANEMRMQRKNEMFSLDKIFDTSRRPCPRSGNLKICKSAYNNLCAYKHGSFDRIDFF